MTPGEFRAVDFDLLADYVGGALDGTPDQAEIARLVSEDPDWAAAHAAMTEAVDSVRVSLASWAGDAPVMPPDVTDRLTAALVEAPMVNETQNPMSGEAPVLPSADEAPTGPPAQRRFSVIPGGRPAKAVVPEGQRPVRSRTAGSGRRRSRLVGPLAAAAAVVAFAGFGVHQLINPAGQSDSVTTSADGGRAADAPESVTGSGPGSPRILVGPMVDRAVATGTDYTATTLPGLLAAKSRQLPGGERAGEASPFGPGALPSVPGLLRLADEDALMLCLDAVTAEHARGPFVVNLADYASFDGRPALVLLLGDLNERWAWVVGPSCGLPGAGADTLHRARVG